MRVEITMPKFNHSFAGKYLVDTSVRKWKSKEEEFTLIQYRYLFPNGLGISVVNHVGAEDERKWDLAFLNSKLEIPEHNIEDDEAFFKEYLTDGEVLEYLQDTYLIGR